MLRLKPKIPRKDKEWVKLLKEYNKVEYTYLNLSKNSSSKEIQQAIYDLNQAKEKLNKYKKGK